MEFKYVKWGSVGFFLLVGNLGVGADLDALRTAIGAISDSQVRRIVLDLGRITRLDCAGLGELIRLRSLVAGAGRAFGLVNVGGRHRRLLELARLDAILVVFDHPKDALQPAPADQWSGSDITPAAFTLRGDVGHSRFTGACTAVPS